MGRYDCGSILSLRGFLIGMMVAIFQSAGTSPLSQEVFITRNNSDLEQSGSVFFFFFFFFFLNIS